MLEADECGDAEDLAAHDKRNGGVRPNAIFRQVIFVAEPCVFFEEIVASVRFAGEFAGFFFVGIGEERASFRQRRRLRVAFGASGKLLGSFAVNRRDANDVECEEAMEVAVFVGRVVRNSEIDDADGVEGDERDEDVGEGREDAGEFTLRADRFPGAKHHAEAVGFRGWGVGLEDRVGHFC